MAKVFSEHKPATIHSYSVGRFPQLTGSYGTGVFDVLPSLSGEEPLLIRLYYPTERKVHEVPESRLAEWMTKPYRKAYFTTIVSKLVALKKPLSSAKIKPRNYRVPAIVHEPPMQPSETMSKFPVVVFSHGLSAMRSVYSMIHCDLASQGYIVAAVEHKDGSACLSHTKTKSETTQGDEPVYEDKWIEFIDAEITALPLRYYQVRQRSSEVSSALDFVTALDRGQEFTDRLDNKFDFSLFKDRIDLDHVVVMGHSYGGGTTVVTLANDPRFKCGVALDTWMFPVYKEVYDLVKAPLVFINSWDFQWPENIKSMQKLVKESDERGPSPCQMFTLRGSTHLSHCDTPFIYPSYYLELMGFHPPDGDVYEVFDASLQVTYAFLKRHLWSDPSPQPILDGGDGQHRLVMSGTNVDPTKEMEDDSSSAQKVMLFDAIKLNAKL